MLGTDFYLQSVNPLQSEWLLDTVGKVWIVEDDIEAESFGAKSNCWTDSAWKIIIKINKIKITFFNVLYCCFSVPKFLTK